MSAADTLLKVLSELKSVAAEYQAGAGEESPPSNNLLLATLARRCARFETEIENAVASRVNSDAADGENRDGLTDQKADERAGHKDVFAFIEERENRLEQLYREILRGENPAPEVRAVLENHLRLVSRWHNFIITEAIDLVFGGEVEIPAELNEKEEVKKYENHQRIEEEIE